MTTAAASVEAVGANLAFWQPYGLDKGLNLVETQRGEVKTARYLFYHTLIFR